MHLSYATLEVRNHIFLLQDDAELCEYCSECLFYVSLPNYTQSVLYWMVLELYLQGQLVSLIGVEFRLHLVSFYEQHSKNIGRKTGFYQMATLAQTIEMYS